MIVSIQLKHYKIYKNINFIPITTNSKFSAFVGQNGIGKTSILCALDKFFNCDNFNSWNINISAKKDGLGESNKPFIVPSFFIKKSDLSGKNNTLIATMLDKYFRETNYSVNSTAKEFSKFYSHRNDILENENIDDYYFFSIGKKYLDKNPFFGLFEKDPNLTTLLSQFSDDKIITFMEYIIRLYTFLYLPVEIDLNEFTKLEKKNMQILTNGKIEKTIFDSITKVDFPMINNVLDNFLKSLIVDLKEYEYKKKGNRNKIKDSDLIEKIIEIYFSTKILHKKSGEQLISIENLSSGEKRKAFIDILLSFLTKDTNKNDKIIIAIDEPEASLHISNCYLQFKKLFNLVEKDYQVLITSHWYGFIPTLSHGSTINISKSNGIYNFNIIDLLYNRSQITSEIKNKKFDIPYDINIKSFNDLVQSILFSLHEESKFNWIICEGISEKIYFEYYFENEIKSKNLKILPAGGNKTVKNIYDYLALPLKDASNNKYPLHGKVFCLIDTDPEGIKVTLDNSLKCIDFKRLLQKDDSVILEKVDSLNISPATEIEDCLDSKIFYRTLKCFADSNELLKKILENNEYVENSITSRESLDLKRSDLSNIKKFFDDNKGYNKVLFAKKYVEIAKESVHSLSWIEKIKEFF